MPNTYVDRIIPDGSVFGKWKVEKLGEAARSGQRRYECKCECGTVKLVNAYHLKNGQSKSCGCDIRRGKTHSMWRGCGDISGNFWDSIKRGASGLKGRRNPVDFLISMEYAWELFIKQDKKCALTGLELVMNHHRKSGKPHTASLDRIDSSLGYIEGNVQWVHKDINMMKRTYSQSYFIQMCKKVAEQN